MYFLILYWSILGVFYFILERKRAADREILRGANLFIYELRDDCCDESIGASWHNPMDESYDRLAQLVQQVRWAIFFAAPALLLAFALSSLMGFGDAWLSFFPAWFAQAATTAGGAVCDYLLEHLFWEISTR